MKILKLTKTNQSKVIAFAALALQKGQTVVYPTDTAYALGAIATNAKALAKIYKIKARGQKPIHVLVPSAAYAKRLVYWNGLAQKLAGKFWPGALSFALKLKSKNISLRKISDSEKMLGLRYPKNSFALQLAKKVNAPITATSANPRGRLNPYSLKEVIKQFGKLPHQPDIIIDAGKLRKVPPSTFVRIHSRELFEITRLGPISETQILKALKR